jgi:RNA polymerase sigma-70 factor, ECF subfamily
MAGSDGESVLLEDQDRSLWDSDQLAVARGILDRAIALRGRGPYVPQAAIASLQTEQEIDWQQIAALYAELAQRTRSPVVDLELAGTEPERRFIERLLGELK